MSFICDYCGKGSQKGHRVSHAKNRSIRRFRPNLHSHKVLENGKKIVRLLCSGCLKKAVKPPLKPIARTNYAQSN